MAADLVRRLDAPCIFVVGKGGVGKSTAAAAVALGFADAGFATHLISTDPAHSISDLFEQTLGAAPATSRCSGRLTLEELDARGYARAWLDASAGGIAELVERGTYLEPEDVRGFFDLALPGVDEVMAAMRLTELAGEAHDRIVVDTAPTGHMLRLLDAADTLAGWATTLEAMAEKGGVVAAALLRRPVRLEGEAAAENLRTCVHRFRETVLELAAFVVVSRPDAVVAAETQRLRGELRTRGLRVALELVVGGEPGDEPLFGVVPDPDLRGCTGLRAFRTKPPRPAEPAGSGSATGAAEVAGGAAAAAAPGIAPGAAPGIAHGAAAAAAGSAASTGRGQPAGPWLVSLPQRLVFFVGKGGVGKTTCAAAFAVARAKHGAVSLFSIDPAGSLSDVFGVAVPANGTGVGPRLRLRQLDAEAEYARFRREYRERIDEIFARIGVDGAAELDRRVVDSLWNVAPPGIDELFALAALLDRQAGEPGRTLVVDASPTGHLLRLVELPAIALDWVHGLMRIVLKYRKAMGLDAPAESLLRLARRLRTLRAGMTDPSRTAAVLVTLPEPVVAAESRRLQARLAAAGIPLVALLHNRWSGPGTPRDAAPPGARPILATQADVPPAGEATLREFFRSWELVD